MYNDFNDISVFFFFGATSYCAINLTRQTHIYLHKPWVGMNEMFLIKEKKKSIHAHDEASKPFFIE